MKRKSAIDSDSVATLVRRVTDPEFQVVTSFGDSETSRCLAVLKNGLRNAQMGLVVVDVARLERSLGILLRYGQFRPLVLR